MQKLLAAAAGLALFALPVFAQTTNQPSGANQPSNKSADDTSKKAPGATNKDDGAGKATTPGQEARVKKNTRSTMHRHKTKRHASHHRGGKRLARGHTHRKVHGYAESRRGHRHHRGKHLVRGGQHRKVYAYSDGGRMHRSHRHRHHRHDHHDGCW